MRFSHTRLSDVLYASACADFRPATVGTLYDQSRRRPNSRAYAGGAQLEAKPGHRRPSPDTHSTGRNPTRIREVFLWFTRRAAASLLLKPASSHAPNSDTHLDSRRAANSNTPLDTPWRGGQEPALGKLPEDLRTTISRRMPFTDQAPGDPERAILNGEATAKPLYDLIGTVKSMRGVTQAFGRSFLKGQAAAAALFSPG